MTQYNLSALFILSKLAREESSLPVARRAVVVVVVIRSIPRRSVAPSGIFNCNDRDLSHIHLHGSHHSAARITSECRCLPEDTCLVPLVLVGRGIDSINLFADPVTYFESVSKTRRAPTDGGFIRCSVAHDICSLDGLTTYHVSVCFQCTYPLQSYYDRSTKASFERSSQSLQASWPGLVAS